MKFAFIVHPRDLNDVYKKYPPLRILPSTVVEFFLLNFWPAVFVAKITGLKTVDSQKSIEGYVISVPLTARQMVEHRTIATKKILGAARLAQKMGASIIGLGGMTSSMSKGGLDLVDKVNINITTGHAYTAYNVTKNVFELVHLFKLNDKEIVTAIVGAAGSIGSTSAILLARAGYQNLILIDLDRKHHHFEDLRRKLIELNPKINIRFSHTISDIIEADIIVTATNAPEALILSEDLKQGAIIIDDAQPTDISRDVFEREDVLVVSAGVVHTPNIETHFNFGLADRFDNFCCLAELLILSAHEWNSNYVINRATIEAVDEISEWGNEMKFELGHFQDPYGLVSPEKIDRIREIIRKHKHDSQS